MRPTSQPDRFPFDSAVNAGFDSDAALHHISRKDKPLADLISRVGAFQLQLRPCSTPFEALGSAIVFQQLTAKSAGAIHQRLLDRFPEKNHPSPSDLLSLDDSSLREVGLSKAKAAALRDLADHAIDGRLPTTSQIGQLDDDAIIKRLSAVKGIGVWTVQMMLIYHLGRPDVMPATDLGIRKGFRLTFGGDLPQPAAILERAKRWSPYRTVASWYLWQATYL